MPVIIVQNGTAPVGNPSAIVSGAGTAAANGTYTYRGDVNGYPYYNLVGQPDDPNTNSIKNNGDWLMTRGDEEIYYVGTNGAAAFPWLTTWDLADVGDAPAPTVTQG